jgi:hypothetical protein
MELSDDWQGNPTARTKTFSIATLFTTNLAWSPGTEPKAVL